MSKRKRISFTVINDLLYDQRMQKICTSLANHGYDVTLIGRKVPNCAPLKTAKFKTMRVKCFFSLGKFFYLEYNLRLLFILLFNKTDIYSAIDCDTLWANYLASKIRSKPLGYDAHELFSEVPEVINRPKVQKFWQYTERKLIPKTAFRYTVSQSIAEHFEKLHKVPFGLVRNAPILKENIPMNEIIIGDFILYQGALNEGRGLENLLLAMQHIDSKLVLIGEGGLCSKLKKMVTELKIENKVEFKGYLPPEEMNKYTNAAKIGINVSENKGLSYYYSLNNKFFDYIHAGLPSVTNDFPEYRDLNDKYEVCLLCTSTAEDLTLKINELLNDSHLYGYLEEKCLLARRFLNWQKEEKKLVAIYDSIQ